MTDSLSAQIPALDDSHIDPSNPLTADVFLNHIISALGPPYRITSDAHYHWVTPFSDEQHKKYAMQAAYALERVGQTIPGLVVTPPSQGWPAILFASVDAQLTYDGLFSGEGNHIINGGCWRSWPIGHLAIPVSEWDALDAAFGHELVHAALSNTGVPIWLQEGLATELETGMGNRTSPLNDLFHWRETLQFWRQHDAQTLWDASAFGDPNSSRHAYAIAQVIALRLTNKPQQLRRACTIGAEAWKDPDAVLRELIGCDRDAIFHNIIDDKPRGGWFERFIYWCFVGDRP